MNDDGDECNIGRPGGYKPFEVPDLNRSHRQVMREAEAIKDWTDDVKAGGAVMQEEHELPLFQQPKILRWTPTAFVLNWQNEHGDDLYLTISKDAVSFLQSCREKIMKRHSIAILNDQGDTVQGIEIRDLRDERSPVKREGS